MYPETEIEHSPEIKQKVKAREVRFGKNLSIQLRQGTHSVSQRVTKIIGSVEVSFRNIGRRRETPRVSEARHVGRRRHAHLGNSIDTLQHYRSTRGDRTTPTVVRVGPGLPAGTYRTRLLIEARLSSSLWSASNFRVHESVEKRELLFVSGLFRVIDGST